MPVPIATDKGKQRQDTMIQQMCCMHALCFVLPRMVTFLHQPLFMLPATVNHPAAPHAAVPASAGAKLTKN
eukprot:363781-Chlamydomonas_euryale.AAC.7